MMTNEETIKVLKDLDGYFVGHSSDEVNEALEIAIQSLTAISKLSKSLKAVNRYEMDKKVLIGFNMAVAIFNKYFGESCALKNEQSEQNVGMCQQNVGELSEKQTDGDLISRQAVIDTFYKYPNISWTTLDILEKINSIPSVTPKTELNGDLISCEVVIEWLKGKDIIKLSSQEETARKELKALSSGELQPYVENMPSADGDLISRKEVLNAIGEEKWEYLDYLERDIGGNYDVHISCFTEQIEKRIEKLPSAEKTAEKEPKTGNWIKYGIPRCGEQHYKCTSCGYYINFGQWGELYTKEFKYCPNCGCRMKKESEEKV